VGVCRFWAVSEVCVSEFMCRLTGRRGHAGDVRPGEPCRGRTRTRRRLIQVSEPARKRTYQSTYTYNLLNKLTG